MVPAEKTNSVSAVGVLITYWCNARCAHCYLRCGPLRRLEMTAEDAHGHFAAIGRLGIDAADIHIGGGEPFGNFAHLLDVLRAAREAGLAGIGYVETNGFWATDDKLVIDRLQTLAAYGVQRISLSVDVYHQAFVDPLAVARLARLTPQVLGERSLRVRRWRSLKAPVDLRGLGSDELRAAYQSALADFPERMTGRAADELAPLLPGRPPDDFRSMNCSRALLESGHVHVDPQGIVSPGTCAGIIIGRATEDQPLDLLLSRPRGQICNRLIDGGPLALAAMAAESGYRPRPQGYADKCHLCTDVRHWLVGRGMAADEIGPASLYCE